MNFFIDACRSEAYNVDTKSLNYSVLDEAIHELASAQKKVKTLLSCSRGEFSYEDKDWQNGAFTKSIVEGLKNQPFKMINKTIIADENEDQVITFNELYRYVSNRVPLMVKAKDKDFKQTPVLSKLHQEDDLPLFFINN